MSNTNVDYKVLKTNIIKACKARRENTIEFEVDLERLAANVKQMKLTPVNSGLISKKVKTDTIPYLNEYFEKTNLSWFNEEKQYTVLTFVETDSIDDTARELIDKLNTAQVDDPEDDKVKDMSALVANYPCYFATVASYRNDNPKRSGQPSYIVICRANKVVIRSSDYQYNFRDMS